MKDTVKRMRRPTTEWNKIFAKDISDNTVIQNTQRILKINNQKTNNPIKQWVKDLNRPHQRRYRDGK